MSSGVGRVLSFVCSHSFENGITIEKELAKRSSEFLIISWQPNRCTGIFNVSNAWETCKNMEEKAGVRKQNSKEKIRKECACLQRGSFFFVISYFTVSPYLKLVGPTQTNQSTSKLPQFRT